jgi:putative transposase
MTPRDPLYAGYRYPAALISYAVWLYFRFPLSPRMVEELLAARGISATYETIRQWGLKKLYSLIRITHPECMVLRL